MFLLENSRKQTFRFDTFIFIILVVSKWGRPVVYFGLPLWPISSFGYLSSIAIGRAGRHLFSNCWCARLYRKTYLRVCTMRERSRFCCVCFVRHADKDDLIWTEMTIIPFVNLLDFFLRSKRRDNPNFPAPKKNNYNSKNSCNVHFYAFAKMPWKHCKNDVEAIVLDKNG